MEIIALVLQTFNGSYCLCHATDGQRKLLFVPRIYDANSFLALQINGGNSRPAWPVVAHLFLRLCVPNEKVPGWHWCQWRLQEDMNCYF